MNEIWKKCLRQLPDLPFLAVFTIYLIHLLFQSSTFYLPVPDGFLKKLFLLLCLTLLPRIPFYLKALKAQKKILAAAVLLSANYILVYHFGDHLFLLFSAVLTIGFFGMENQKALKLFTIVLGCFLVLTFSAACCGAIEDFVMMKDGYIRTALGICYPTDMASYVLFLLMYSWAAWKRIPDLIAVFLGIICLFFSRYIAMSITGTICSIVFCVVVLGHFLCVECGFGKGFPSFLHTLARQMMTFAFPLLALLMFLLIFAYSRNVGPALRINSILSDRLKMPWDAFCLYGLRPFGFPFPQNGNGFTTFASNNYNFVDSTYPLILIRYGWILFLALCAAWTLATRNAFRNHNTRLACLMALIAFHSFSEHHFIEVNFNLLLVMPFSAFSPSPAIEKRPVREELLRNARILPALCVFTVLSAWILPVFFTWTRTIFQLNQWTGGGWNGLPVLRLLSGMYGAAALIVTGTLYAISAIRSRRSEAPKRNAALGIIASAAGFAVVFSLIQAGNNYIDRSVSNYSRQLAEEESALQLVTEASSGKVYIDSLPKVYQQKFPGISNSLLLGDELARFYNTSVIMDIKYDSNCFINSGFLFTPISSRHALYTNDSTVINALKKQGYHLTGYYNVRKSVNLKYLSEINQLPYSKKTGLALSGNDQALKYGPYLSLYHGLYTVDYTFHLSEDSAADEIPVSTPLATLRVSAFNGEKLLKEYVLKNEGFDTDGNTTISVPFYSSSYPEIEFQVIPEKDLSFNITAIRYRRTPQYDVHNLYNKKRQKYREEYYTLEGTPSETADGYIACEYEYDYDGRIIEIRYYDANNDPVLTNNGFASLKREFDNHGRIIRESYFDEGGLPTLCSGGYASVSRAYDANDNVIVSKHYNTAGKPTATTSLYSELHRVYNENHQVILESYYDTNGSPLNMPDGYAMIEFQYDSNGRACIHRYLDKDGQPVITMNHYAEIHREFTPQNQISKESYFDTKGEPLTLPSGYAMVKTAYDEKGNAILTEYCDADGSRVMTNKQYSALRRRYDDRNHIIYEAYFDTNDLPVLISEHYAAVSYERNVFGDATNFKFFDINGDPVLRFEGYSEVIREYSENRLPIRDIYLDTNGKPVITVMQYAEIRREFNDLRQITREYYYGTDGKPMVLSLGQASVIYERDAFGQPVVLKYYGLENTPITTTAGYAELHREYDENHQIISESFFDTDGSPVSSTSGFHMVKYQRASDGSVLSQKYFDIHGNEVLQP